MVNKRQSAAVSRRGSKAGKRLAVVTVSAAAALAVVMPFVSPVEAADVKGVARVAKDANKDGAKYQKQVDKLQGEHENLLADYEAVLQQSEALSAYNAQLAKLVKDQDTELASLEEQIGRVTVVSRALTPLMLQMIDALGSFVELDVPFLLQERRDRIQRLKDMMDKADVSESEKYRQIVEAYQIETDYGRTIERYQDEIAFEGEKRTVNFLRVGRVVLAFQSLDGEIVGHWNTVSKAFETLDEEHSNAIKYGLQVAGKQRAPNDLLMLPIAAGAGDSAGSEQ